MDAALRIHNLHKDFSTGFIPKRKRVLKGISFTVESGQIFGYLGPNGAGKTTTIKCILGLIFPDSGKIDIFGKSHLHSKSRGNLGFLPENPYFYDYLTGAEFLDFYGQLFGYSRDERSSKIQNLLNLVGLEKAANLQLRKFSRGMLQRIGLAQSLINDPEIILLDEPLGGLDPLGRKEIRDIIVNLRSEGKTVFLSSHILQDIEMICDRVAVIVDGRIISQGKLEELISQDILFTELIVSGIEESEFEEFGVSISSHGGKILLKIFEEEKMDRIFSLVHARKGKIHSLVPRNQTLEDIFMGIVQRK